MINIKIYTIIYLSLCACALNAFISMEKAITVYNESPDDVILIIHNRWCSPILDPAAENTYKFLVQQELASAKASSGKEKLTPPQPKAICYSAIISSHGSVTYRPQPPLAPLLGIEDISIEIWNSTTNTTGTLTKVPWRSIIVYPRDMNIQKTVKEAR